MIEESFLSGSSVIHRLSPEIRILCACILSVPAALCSHFGVVCLYFCAAVVLVSLARLDPVKVAGRVKPVLWFLLMIWVFLPLTFDGKILYQLGFLKIAYPGVLLAGMISIKSITIVLIFTAFIATLSVAAIGSGLHRLHVPDKLVFLLLMSYRYIAVIEEEYRRLMRAARFRGFKPGTNLHSYKTFAYLAGMLFVRASVRANRVYQAMLCRGFDGKFHTLDVSPPNGLNYPFLTAVSTAGILLVILEKVWAA